VLTPLTPKTMTSLLLILAIFCSAQLARGEGLHSTVYGYKKNVGEKYIQTFKTSRNVEKIFKRLKSDKNVHHLPV